MTRQLLVRQGGGAADEVDLFEPGAHRREGAPAFEGDAVLFEMGGRWEQGQSAMGYFRFVDPTAASGLVFRPHATVKLTEDASGTEYILAWNRIGGGWDVGRRTELIGGDEIEEDIQLMDSNLDLRAGLPFEGGWSRPAETTWERLQALAAAKLAGSSSTAPIHRSTTNITVDRFTNGHLVDATDPLDMEARDYDPGTDVSDVLDDIMGQWGKGWGVTMHHVEDEGTHRCLLVLDPDNQEQFTSDLRVSDDPDDWDPTDLTAPTLEPIWRSGRGKRTDNDAVISGLISIYGGTDENPQTLTVETGEAPEDWEVWWDVFHDDVAHGAVPAERRANFVLNDRKRPYTSLNFSILLLPEQTHLITAGQSIEVKSVVVNQDSLKHEFTPKRIAQVTWEPAPDGRWYANLQLDRPRGAHPLRGGNATEPKPPPFCADDPGDTLLKFYNAEDSPDDEDAINWTGSSRIAPSTGGANGTDKCYFKSGSPNKYQTTHAATAGESYRFEGYIGSDSAGFLIVVFTDAAPGTGGGSFSSGAILATHTLTPAQPNIDAINFTHWSAGPFEAPPGTTSMALGRVTGVTFDEVKIYHVTAPVDNDPFCVPEGSYDPDDPYYSPGSHNHDGRYALINHSHLMDDLIDADTTSTEPQDGDVLTWNDVSEQWEPLAPSAFTDSGQFVTTTDGGKEVIQNHPAAGSTETLDLGDGNYHDVTLTADCTLTLTGATNGVACTMNILLRQGSGAPWDVTWPGSVSWVSGSAPTLATAEDEWNWVVLTTLDGGTVWFGDAGGSAGGGGGGSGHTIKEDGTPLTARAGLNFGSGIVATDDSGNNETDVDLDWGEDADVSTQAFGDAAATGTSQEVARAGHKHGMPANPVTAHEAASDPHTGYMLESLASAKGELWGASANDTPAMVAASTEGQVLVGRSAATAGNSFETQYAALEMVIGNGLAVISTGVKGYIRVPFACEIVRESILADVSGAIKIDVWVDTYANYPPTDADTITGGNEPEIAASGTKDEDSTLTSWTKTLAEGSVIGINVDSCTSIKQVTFELRVKRT